MFSTNSNEMIYNFILFVVGFVLKYRKVTATVVVVIGATATPVVASTVVEK